ncbi:flagellar M-ring protein FliF [Pyruvatibacter mobilis]|uniref:Flagellar M-ring protein n=2 Tax=Pyruvatibacter mobilis TaxID=1712261 RepID=A0A845QEB5_9HYPH|nr:flagellar M-ring protein FliF [Pyruvatibacter mobilis]QJD74340.1 flagellar M-ring protein FliF [Pyruvatibacter mobilis]
MDGTLGFLRGLGPMRLLALGSVTIALIAFFAVIMMRVSSPTMSLLYSDLSVSDSAEIIAKLDGLNIPYELKGDGTTILVPKDEALRLRMSMAQAGLPSGGSVGYEIFDNTSALGTTSFVQNMNHLRALEGELARTIRALDSVQAARVHLVMPERELFTRERQDPTASIVIKSRGGLARSQAKGIQFLVASAVEGLIPSNVSIIDETGVMIAGGIEGDAGGSASLDERQREYENRLRRQVADIVTSVVGSNRARIQVAAEMDFNRITRNSETFDPEGQVVRSTQTVEESSSATERDPEAGVTVGNNLPDAIGQGGGENNATNSESAARVEETVNYEISRTTTTEVVEAGRIKRLSVAVLVDGLYETAEDGTQTYTARTQEELELIGRLVRSAIGFDETRGDKVEVVNLQLNANAIDPLSADDAEQGFVDGLMANLDPMRLAELGALLIVTILAIFLVARPLIARLTTPGVQEAGPAAIAGGAPAGTPQLPSPDMKAILEQAVADGQEVIRGPDGEPIALANPTPEQQAALALEDETSAMIDIAQIEGQVRESSIRKIGELVQNHPEESLSILRGWLHETA